MNLCQTPIGSRLPSPIEVPYTIDQQAQEFQKSQKPWPFICTHLQDLILKQLQQMIAYNTERKAEDLPQLCIDQDILYLTANS